MPAFSCPALARCLQLYLDADEAAGLSAQLAQVNGCNDLLPLYDHTIPLVEAALWESGLAQEPVADLHALFTEMEGHIAVAGNDRRYRFVVVIPVADRPQQLRACLQSLTGMAQAFRYGAGSGVLSKKLRVVIADDSRAPEHIASNRAITADLEQSGLDTVYFGLQEQQALLAELSAADRRALHNVIGNTPDEAFYHKGASIMRNITSLMLRKLALQDERVLFMFADSDQKFHTCTDPDRELFTTNYFYHLDRIFSHGKVQVLTGKVVGDPPVSPAVMAGTLLDDVLAFLGEMAVLDADAACSFHQTPAYSEDAAYHDMAGLFGFNHSGKAHRYQCSLTGAHDHAACLAGFACALHHFLDGEHPTRITPYQHADVQASVTPARTVYTGNYVLSSVALKYFIPFAGLGLRMAGPVLGRLIQAGSGDAFVSANLPMLHRRTVEKTGGAEFRPGVDHSAPMVDLSGEFERQFFGDVMLFTVVELVKQGYPEVMPAADDIRDCVIMVETRLREHYAENQTRILTRLVELETLLAAPGHWWRAGAQYEQTRALLVHFAASVHANFSGDSRSYRFINDEENCRTYRQAIAEALLAYNLERECWEQVLRNLA
jgi:hypothetical protein